MFLKFLKIPFYKSDNIYKYVTFISLLVVIPSVALLYTVCYFFGFFELNVVDFLPKHDLSNGISFLSICVYGPVVENFFMVSLIRVFRVFIKNKIRLCLISALFWGFVHALIAPLWFFGVVWSFYCFSAVYVGFKKKGFLFCFLVSFLFHMINNFFGVCLVVFDLF